MILLRNFKNAMEDVYGLHGKSKGFILDAVDDVPRFFQDHFNKENQYTMEIAYNPEHQDQDYRFNQKVPLGHHYYGYGPGQRLEYNDEFAWGGFDPRRDLGWNWGYGQGKGIIEKKHNFGPNTYVNGTEIWDRREHTDFGKQFDQEHLLLLDINTSADGNQFEWYDGVQNKQPDKPVKGIPEAWVLEEHGSEDDIKRHCAKYPGAGIVKMVSGVYKQCCFKGDICQLEYEADRHNADVTKMGPGWSVAKDEYDWQGSLLDTWAEKQKTVPVHNSIADANLLMWGPAFGAVSKVGGVAAEAIGVAARPAASVIAGDIAGDVLGTAGEDVGEMLGDVVGDVGENPGVKPPEPVEPPEPTGGGEVPETPEETTPSAEEETPPPTKPKPISEVIQDAVGAAAGAYLPGKTLPTSSAAPSITSPHSAELKQPDRHAPVSDDSIKLEGVLIAVVGITAGALILRHYWPGK